MIEVFDTRTQQLVPVPEADTISIYVCGITPYDSMHLGHVAAFLVYDVLARRLRQLGRPVRLVRNITDVDDPLLPKAQSLGISYAELVEREVAQMAEDITALDLVADAEPAASRYVEPMATAIQELLDGGHAYRLDASVYFAVDTDPGYGSFSRLGAAAMREQSAEHGGDPDRPGKRNPLDFVLWQPSREGEPRYDTVVGSGRPGWHIGCSVMSRAELGEHVDIHGGGDDLIFPHHESELAQNQALPGGSEVTVWLHVAPLAYAGEKMSKSLGNVVLARDLLRTWDPRVVRLALLTHYHHRRPSEWFENFLAPAAELLARLERAAQVAVGPDLAELVAEFGARLDDDIDTPGAVAVLDRAVTQTLRDDRHDGGDTDSGAAIRAMAAELGVPLGGPSGDPGDGSPPR